jgi:hypothetical protein
MPAVLLVISACGAPAADQVDTESEAGTVTPVSIAAATTTASENGKTYQIEYVVTPDPEAEGAVVELILSQDAHLLREIDMRAPPAQISDASGDGMVLHNGDRLVWQPPQSGGTLRWFVKINHRRNTRSYDALITSDWAIFRAEDIIPQAASRALRGASSQTRLTFHLPRKWSSITEYSGVNDSYDIQISHRRFDRPAGWILLGELGTRYEEIAGIRVNVAAPVGQGLRRMDILALLRWNLPEVVRIFPDFPGRLTIIGAGDPMWRGGLSGPRSLFIHADRPLLSENSTSTLLHEIMHMALGGRAGTGADWIVEGLAEYYGLLILRRTGTISDVRYSASLKKLEEWGKEADQLCAVQSSGPATAKAVTVFSALDAEIRRRTRGKSDLDDVIRALATSEKDITIQGLLAASGKLLESAPESLSPENLPGCDL